MNSERDSRFRALMAELDGAYAEYRNELQAPTTPLGSEPPVARHVDWEAWERTKNRYDAARDASLRFLRGEE